MNSNTIEPLRVLDPSARTLTAGDLRAVVLPSLGMLGASLQYSGKELLGRVDDIAGFAREGRTCGIPLLYPWANRIEGAHYRAAGREVTLDRSSPLLHFDGILPMHGVPWGQLVWNVTAESASSLRARLDWTSDPLLAIFPFPHQLEMALTLRPEGLTVETTVLAGASGPVPLCFGFHPYVRIPGVPRAAWELELPAMQRLELDDRHLPTGQTTPVPALQAQLGEREFDDGFALHGDHASFSIAGGTWRISFSFQAGYPYAQVYAPGGKDFIAIEPMTAPTNALASGQALRLVEAGGIFRAIFAIRVEANAESPKHN